MCRLEGKNWSQGFLSWMTLGEEIRWALSDIILGRSMNTRAHSKNHQLTQVGVSLSKHGKPMVTLSYGLLLSDLSFSGHGGVPDFCNLMETSLPGYEYLRSTMLLESLVPTY